MQIVDYLQSIPYLLLWICFHLQFFLTFNQSFFQLVHVNVNGEWRQISYDYFFEKGNSFFLDSFFNKGPKGHLKADNWVFCWLESNYKIKTNYSVVILLNVLAYEKKLMF